MAEPAQPLLLTPSLAVTEAARVQINLFGAKTRSLVLNAMAEPRTDIVHVVGSFAGGEAGLWIDQDTLRRLVAETSAVTDLGKLPKPLLTALAQLALSPVIERLHDELGLSFVIQSSGIADLPQGMRIELPLDRAGSVASLTVTVDALDKICADLAMRPNILRPDNAERATVTLLFEAGRLDLSLGQLAGLRPGDALLPDNSPTLDRAAITVSAGAATIGTAQLRDTQIEIDTWRMQAMPDLDTETDDATIDDTSEPSEIGPIPIHDVDVSLRFCLASQEVTVAELSSMGVGHIFDLDQPLDGLVQIFAGKKRLGIGELVTIADRVGVRLIRLTDAENG